MSISFISLDFFIFFPNFVKWIYLSVCFINILIENSFKLQKNKNINRLVFQMTNFVAMERFDDLSNWNQF